MPILNLSAEQIETFKNFDVYLLVLYRNGNDSIKSYRTLSDAVTALNWLANEEPALWKCTFEPTSDGFIIGNADGNFEFELQCHNFQ
jgi:hypothetical protein